MKGLKKEDKINLAIAFIMIVFLLFMLNFSFISSPPETDTKKANASENENGIKVPSLEEVMSLDFLDDMMKEFIGEDSNNTYTVQEIEGFFSFSYPASWVEMNREIISSENKNIEILFSAYSHDITKQMGITVLKINLDRYNSDIYNIEESLLDVIISLLKKEAEKQNTNIEIEVVEEERYIIKVSEEEQVTPPSWHKIICKENSCFLLAFSSLQENEKGEEVREEIFSSVQIKK